MSGGGQDPRELIARFGQKMVDRLRDSRLAAAVPDSPPADPELAVLDREIGELIAVLEAETRAAETGRLATLAESGPRKAEALARVEERLAGLPGLQDQLAQHEPLRARLDQLRATAARNAAMLSAAAESARLISDEIQRIRDRHSTAGLYGRDGQTRERDEGPGKDRIDRAL
ncbi:hypothetical protein [Frigidibacter sp. MR17.24]|uniref:hypothetical protein n=1 Tax=Frigidibacter sp. MR17.24 TaxID=3127345 RepID=UPI0030131E60